MSKHCLAEKRKQLATCRRNAKSHRLVEHRRYYAGKAEGIEAMLPIIERLYRRLEAADERIRELRGTLEMYRQLEAERRKLARENHDEIRSSAASDGRRDRKAG